MARPVDVDEPGLGYEIRPEEPEDEEDVAARESLPAVAQTVLREVNDAVSPNVPGSMAKHLWNWAVQELGRAPTAAEYQELLVTWAGQEGGAAGPAGAAAPTLSPEEQLQIDMIPGLSQAEAKRARAVYPDLSVAEIAWQIFGIPVNEEQTALASLRDIIAESDLTSEDIVALAALIPDATEDDLVNMAGWGYTPQDYARLRRNYEEMGLDAFYSLEQVAQAEKQGTTPMQLQQGIEAERRAEEAERRGVSPEWMVYGAGGRLPPTPGAAMPGAGPMAPEGMTQREFEAEWAELPLPERIAFGVPGAEAEYEALQAEREVREALQERVREGIAGGPYYGRGPWAVRGLQNVFLPAMQLWATDINRAFGPEVAAQGIPGVQAAFDRLTTEQYAQAQAGELPRFGGGEPVPITSVPLPSWWWGDPKDFPAAMAAERKRARGEELTPEEQELIDELGWRRRFYEETHPTPPPPEEAEPIAPPAVPAVPEREPPAPVGTPSAPVTSGPPPAYLYPRGMAPTVTPTAGGPPPAYTGAGAPAMPTTAGRRRKAPTMPSVPPPIGGAGQRRRRRRGAPRIPAAPSGFRKMPSMSRV